MTRPLVSPIANAAAATYKTARRTARRTCNERKSPKLILSSRRANNLFRARYEFPRWLRRPAACAADGARAPEQHSIRAPRRCHRAFLRERSSVRRGPGGGAGAPKSQLRDEEAAVECRQRLRLDQWYRRRYCRP